jgi:MFS family permease
VSPTFRSLHNPNYRLWSAGALVSNTGTWMQRVAQDWLVLTVLTHNSGLAVGITTGLQFAPVLLLAPYAGAVADRLQRRRVLIFTQSGMGVLAGLLGLLVVTHTAQLWHVYVFATLLGVVAAVDAPARQAFVSEMVPTEDLSNAVGLNSASFHAGRLIGPGVAGLLIHWFGTGPVFLINAASFGAVLLSLTLMQVGELIPSPRVPRGRGGVRAGLAYVRGRPDILLVMVIVGMVGTFGLNFQITTALMARLAFHKGSGEYGLLGSIMAIGSLSGALLAARRERPTIRLVIGATAAFGVFTGIAALMPTYQLFAVALIPVGLSALTLMTAANSNVQLSTAPQLRGRVMALYMAVFTGGTPLGSPIIGWIGEQFGPRWTILVGSAASLITAAGAVLWLLLTPSGRFVIRHVRTGEPRTTSGASVHDHEQSLGAGPGAGAQRRWRASANSW